MAPGRARQQAGPFPKARAASGRKAAPNRESCFAEGPDPDFRE